MSHHDKNEAAGKSKTGKQPEDVQGHKAGYSPTDDEPGTERKTRSGVMANVGASSVAANVPKDEDVEGHKSG